MLLSTKHRSSGNMLPLVMIILSIVVVVCCDGAAPTTLRSSEPLFGWSVRRRITKADMPRPYTIPWSSLDAADVVKTITARQRTEYGYIPTALNGLAISSHVATTSTTASTAAGKNANGVSVLPLTTSTSTYIPATSTSSSDAADWVGADVTLGLFPEVADLLKFAKLDIDSDPIRSLDIQDMFPNLTTSIISDLSNPNISNRLQRMWRGQRAGAMCLNTATSSSSSSSSTSFGSKRLRGTNLDFCDNVGGAPMGVLGSSTWGEGSVNNSSIAPRPITSSSSATALCRHIFWEADESGFGGPGRGGGAFGLVLGTSNRRSSYGIDESSDVISTTTTDSNNNNNNGDVEDQLLNTVRRAMSPLGEDDDGGGDGSGRRLSWTSSLLDTIVNGNNNGAAVTNSTKSIHRRALRSVSDIMGFATLGQRQSRQNGFLVSSDCQVKMQATFSLTAPSGITFATTPTTTTTPATTIVPAPTPTDQEVILYDPPTYVYVSMPFKVRFGCSCNGGAASVPVQIRGTMYQRRIFKQDVNQSWFVIESKGSAVSTTTTEAPASSGEGNVTTGANNTNTTNSSTTDNATDSTNGTNSSSGGVSSGGGASSAMSSGGGITEPTTTTPQPTSPAPRLLYARGSYVVESTVLGPQSTVTPPTTTTTTALTTPPSTVYTSNNMVAVWSSIDAFNSAVHSEGCVSPTVLPSYNATSQWLDTCISDQDILSNSGGFESTKRGAYCGLRTGLGVSTSVDISGRLWEDASTHASRAAMILGTIPTGSVESAIDIAATSASRRQIAALGTIASETMCRAANDTSYIQDQLQNTDGMVPGSSISATSLQQTATPSASPLDASYIPDPTLPYEDAMWGALAAIRSSFSYALSPSSYQNTFHTNNSNIPTLSDEVLIRSNTSEGRGVSAGVYSAYSSISRDQYLQWQAEQLRRRNVRSIWGRSSSLLLPSMPPTNNTMIGLQRMFRMQLTQAAMTLTCKSIRVPSGGSPLLATTSRTAPFPAAVGPDSSDSSLEYPYPGQITTTTTTPSYVLSSQSLNGSNTASELLSTLYPPAVSSATNFNATYLRSSGVASPFAYRYWQDCTPSTLSCVDITQQGATLAADPVLTTAHRQYRLMSPFSLPVTDGSTTTISGQRGALLNWLSLLDNSSATVASPFSVANSAFTLSNQDVKVVTDGGGGVSEVPITVLETSTESPTDYIDYDHNSVVQSVLNTFTSGGRFTGKFYVEGLRNVTIFVPYRVNISRTIVLSTSSTQLQHNDQLAYLDKLHPCASPTTTTTTTTSAPATGGGGGSTDTTILRSTFEITLEMQRYEAVTIHQRVLHVGCSHCEGGEQSTKVAFPFIPTALLHEPPVATAGGDGSVVRVISASRICETSADNTTSSGAVPSLRVYLDPDSRGNGLSMVSNILMTHASNRWYDAGLLPTTDAATHVELNGITNTVPYYSLGTQSLQVQSSKAPVSYRHNNPAVPATLNVLCDSLSRQNSRTVTGASPTTVNGVFRSDRVSLQDASSYLPPSRVSPDSVLQPPWSSSMVSLQTTITSPRTPTCDKASTCYGNGCCERWESNRRQTLFKSTLPATTAVYPTIDYGSYLDGLLSQWFVANPLSVCIDAASDRTIGNFYTYAYDVYWSQLYGGTYYDPSGLGGAEWVFFSPNVAIKDGVVASCICFDLPSLEGSYAGAQCSACDVSYSTTSDGGSRGIQGQPTTAFAKDDSSFYKCTVAQPQLIIFLTDLSTRPLAMTAPTLVIVVIFLLIGYVRRSWVSDQPLKMTARRKVGMNVVTPHVLEDHSAIGGAGEAVKVFQQGGVTAGSGGPQPALQDAHDTWQTSKLVFNKTGQDVRSQSVNLGPTAGEIDAWRVRGAMGRGPMDGAVVHPPHGVNMQAHNLAELHPYNRIKEDLRQYFNQLQSQARPPPRDSDVGDQPAPYSAGQMPAPTYSGTFGPSTNNSSNKRSR